MWATVHLSRDEGKLRRINRNSEVRKIQTVCETVQAQISDLRLRDQEIFMAYLRRWIGQMVIGANIRYLMDEFLSK